MREQESIVDACFIKKNPIPFTEGRILGSSFQYCFMQSFISRLVNIALILLWTPGWKVVLAVKPDVLLCEVCAPNLSAIIRGLPFLE